LFSKQRGKGTKLKMGGKITIEVGTTRRNTISS
jgi:hypothetical protein